MSQNHPPSVADLLSRYLHEQIDAHARGLGYPEPGDEATPFEAAPVQPVDPRLAWNDAVLAARLLAPSAEASAVPPEWPALVAQQEPAVAVAFCLGNFPQLVRNVHPLLTGEPAALRQGPGQPLALPALAEWAAQATEEPARYVAAGALRLARRFDLAGQLLAAAPGAGWEALRANEAAALAWHRGDGEEALARWRAQAESVPVLFNRGMAALFLGRGEEASAALDAAITQLPDSSAWHHLAHLYRALAQR
jgi:tetratricopeptide (TPR) repeat protein